MNSQNVNTAASESSERWGENPATRLACFIIEQEFLLGELCGLVNRHLEEQEQAEEVFNILNSMSNNVFSEGVLCWERPKPLISLAVVKPWLQAKEHAIRLYGTTGQNAWEYSRKSLEGRVEVELCIMRL